MPDSASVENDFLSHITACVDENLSNEQFGVTELADRMNMSRSNLLRKVKKQTKLSVSQLIRQIRLQRGMEMLRKSSLNVSEVSHRVGFGSTSYFIKCFREYYGYPPGEVGKREEAELRAAPVVVSGKKQKFFLAGGVGLITLLVAGLFFYYYKLPAKTLTLEKSVVVLPFKNDSNDSTNIYLINGLMESTLNNLQNIKELKVLSRTSAEKYRTTSRSIPEMAKELNVNYFVEGSGQKIGNQILLNIQLIEGPTDNHLWAKQYRREAKDIFALQQEIAKDIANEIEAIITPEEKQKIENNPTDDPVAYDLYLKGSNLFYLATGESLEQAIPYFKQAIERDPEFTLAYANMTMVYYYLDLFQAEKKYSVEINNYSNKALSLDPELAESLIARALYFMDKKEYKQAVPYFEKAIALKPNSGLVLHFLVELYNLYAPDTGKYLEYSLMKVRMDIASADSMTTSFNYMNLSNALVEAGFIKEALVYINKSLDFNPRNPFSRWVKPGVLYAQNKDLQQLKQHLLAELERDSTQFFIMQEIGKTCYTMRDYKGAYEYYTRFMDLQKRQHLDIFKNESLTIGIVYAKMGQKEKSETFMKLYKEYADGNETIYKDLNLASYYAYRGESQKAIGHLEAFSHQDNFKYWVLLLADDPCVDGVKDLPEFKKAMGAIESKFWNTHKKIRQRLEKKELL